MESTAGDQAEEKKSNYDWKNELKAFEESKAGVKGLVYAGVSKIPLMFIHKQNVLQDFSVSTNSNVQIPLIDLDGINKDASLRSTIIDQVKNASEKWGFFQLINHGIPISILDEMLNGVRRFHEQDAEAKKEYYTRDYSTKQVLYNSNHNLLGGPAACWRDTLTYITGVYRPLKPEELPPICRDIIIKYTNEIMKLGKTVHELLSEALGLNPNHLNDIGCGDGIFAPCHYYPACPEPHLTLGTLKHADPSFITILLQDQIGGLQVLHENQWIDVKPVAGALVVNIGDLLQLISNDKFMSAYHRVVAKNEGPRISVACIFRTHHHPENSYKLYGPVKEFVSEENPPIYRQITVKEIIQHLHQEKTDRGTSQPQPKAQAQQSRNRLPSVLDRFKRKIAKKNMRTRFRRLKTEMEEISKEQESIKEGQRQVREKFEAIEEECERLRKESDEIIRQSAITGIRLNLMLNIFKARQEGNFPRASHLTLLLREIMART